MKIKNIKIIFLIILVILSFSNIMIAQDSNAANERRILVSEYRDKMMAGWIGQMVGVGWGAPTEFQFTGKIIPEDKVPEWKPEMVNVFQQDDLYVEMTFLKTLEDYGFDVSINQAGIDFANSGYMLWHANRAGRENLRKGIAPPNSGHPNFTKHADDIDYQIEADYSGLIAPGLPNTVIELGEKFGRIMNYGDGLYGGQFVGGLYAEAFFVNDPIELVKRALKYIPEGSQYAEAVRDVLKWHNENPNDWIATWELINEKYHKNPEYRQFTCANNDEESSTLGGAEFNIDAKLNGAYIVMGLLYGNSDLDNTTVISMRCGQDSDCNPSNAAGALFTMAGYKNLPERFVTALDRETKFSFTDYSFPELIDVTEKLATQAIIRAGGRVETNVDGEKEFIIPVVEPQPSALEQSHNPGPISNNVFTKEELRKFDGHWIYKYSFLVVLLLTFLLFKENRSIKAMPVLIPLIVIVALASFFRSTMDPEMLGMLDVASVYISFATGITVLLLLSSKLIKLKQLMLILSVAVVFGLIGYISIVGFAEGRVIASTKNALFIFGIQAFVWIISIVIAGLLTKKKYSRIRFNLLLLLVLFILNCATMFFLSKFLWFLGGGFGLILMGGIFLTIIQYIVTLPFLILTYISDEYDRRLKQLLLVTD